MIGLNQIGIACLLNLSREKDCMFLLLSSSSRLYISARVVIPFVHFGFSAIVRLQHAMSSHRSTGRGGGGRGSAFAGRNRRGGGRSGRGGGGGGGDEQRWWDPVWRAERLQQLRQNAPKAEVVNEDEWWAEMQQMKESDRREMIIKKNYGTNGHQVLSDMARQLGLYFHAYNKGKTLVVSKLPLPNYRADLDERHGSTQKEILMSRETERRVENLLVGSKQVAYAGRSVGAVNQASQYLRPIVATSECVSQPKVDLVKVNCSLELKELQDKRKESKSSKSLQSFREKLPAYKMRSDFLKAVAHNQVLVVSGETGCGKTTQLPQFILEEEISSLRGAQCNIICTQPRRISAVSVAARVSLERGENLGETIGYQIRLEARRSAQTRLLFCTTGVLLRKLVQEPDLSGITHLLVDEIHERGMNEDFLIIILRDLLQRRPDLHLILMSATINADMFASYFGKAPVICIPGFTFPVEVLFLEDVLEKTHYNIKSNFDGSQSRGKKRRQSDLKGDSLVEAFEEVDVHSHYNKYSMSTRQSLESWSASDINLELVETTIEHICRCEGDGAILVFLTGWNEISKLLEKIKENHFLGNSDKFLILPLHSSMPTINQREVFDRPPSNMRKIVLATNIAESSITIDDIVYVIDCGKAKETSYDALNKLACLLPSWISKASAHQRRGRAGRVQPGICYRLYPKLIYDAMPQYQLPEILRTPLQELCLSIKSLQLGEISSFLGKSLQPPDSLSVQNAIELLKTIGALDEYEELTPLGRHLSTLPLDPNIGKMLLMGCIFQCLDPALTIAAALAHRDPFVLPLSKREEADAAKRSFAEDSCSDHLALLRAFDGWKEAKRHGRDRTFCWQNFLSPTTLQLMDSMRNQFFDLLSDIGFVNKNCIPEVYNRYSNDIVIVRAMLCAGLYPNVVQCKRRGKRTAFYSREVGKVDIHPSSVNAVVHIFPRPYIIYTEKVKTTSIFIRDLTNISMYELLLFGGNLTCSGTGEGIEMLGGYLQFSASGSVIQLIKKLKEELVKLLWRKIEEPGLDISVDGKGVVDAAVELLHSQNITS